MLRTLVLCAVGLGMAAGGPWAYSRVSGYLHDTPARPSIAAPRAAGPTGGRLAVAGDFGDADDDHAPILDLADALRFDITPGHVLSRWPRVSTGMGQLQLQGYRVPLITGTSDYDVAGSLTYYFNPQQQLQRIAFYGTTGNPQTLVTLLTTRFGFTRRILNDPGVFIYEVPEPGDSPRSMLHVQSADVIKRSDAHRRFKVSLLIERPGK